MLNFLLLLEKAMSLSLTPIPESFPPPRMTVQSSAVYDKAGDQIITIGGWDPISSKTYESIISFNLTSKRFSTIIPTSKFEYGNVYGHQIFMRKDRKIISFGLMSGCYSFNLLNSEWNIETLSGDPFPYLIDFGSTQFEWKGKETIAIFGGVALNEITNDLYLIDLDAMINEKINQKGKIPMKRAASSIVFYNDSLYLFGLDEDSIENLPELYKFDLNTEIWEILEVQGDLPSSRLDHHAFVFKDDMFLLFGAIFAGKTVSDVYRFGFIDNTWKKIGDYPNEKRYNSPGLIIEDKIYLLYGRNDEEFTNDIIMFKVKDRNLSISTISANFLSPPARKFHCSVVINENMYVYGGEMAYLNGDSSVLSDMWRFNFEKKVWEGVTFLGTSPSPRSNSPCVLVESTCMLIFGGNYQETYFNDLYYYFEPKNIWYPLTFQGEAPTPRGSSCIAYFQYTLYIIGGKNQIRGFDEIWHYSYENKKYTQIKIPKKNSILGNDIHDCHAYCIAEGDSVILYILGGQSFKSIPNNYLHMIELDGLKIKNINKTYINVQVKIKSTLLRIEDQFLIIGGYIFDYIVRSPLIVYDLSKNRSSIYNFSLNSEKEIGKMITLYGHSAVHYKNSIYIFGGISSADYLRSFITISNNFYELSFKNSEWMHLPCSEGTTGSECNPCKQGTFYSEKNCLPCPKGSFSNKTALNSVAQCLPCPYGEYSDIEGAVSCRHCPSHSVCPIGSPSIRSAYFLQPNQSIQPAQFKNDSKKYEYIVEILFRVFISVGAFSFLMILCFKWFRQVVEKWDLFIANHKHELGVPVILRRNLVGGVFSLGFYLSAVLTVVTASLAFGYSNTYELRALVPLISLDHEIISDKIIFNFTFYMYGDECRKFDTQQGKIIVIEKDLSYEKRTVSRQKVQNNCEVIVKYSKLSLPSNQASILVQMKEETSSATAFTVSATSDSSIPGESSTGIMTISTDSNDLAFRGVDPTIFYFKFIPSVIVIKVFTYESSQEVKKSAGFHVFSSQEPTLGQRLSYEMIYSNIYVFLKVVIYKSETAMETTRLERQSVFNFLGGLLGSVFGLMGTFIALMGTIEDYVDKFEKYKKNRENIGKCLDHSKKLDYQFGLFHEHYKGSKVSPLDSTNIEV